MKHRHLVHRRLTAAAIEDVLDRGTMPDWVPLIEAIRADPYGEIAERTREICDRVREHPLFGAPVFRRVIADARRPRP